MYFANFIGLLQGYGDNVRGPLVQRARENHSRIPKRSWNPAGKASLISLTVLLRGLDTKCLLLIA